MLPQSILILVAMVMVLLKNGESYSYSYSFKKLHLPSGSGSESIAFESDNQGPYTGLNDGRIIKFQPHNTTFLDFAATSPNRPKALCDGKNGDDSKLGPLCGRPIGLDFHHVTGELYIVDAFRGLMLVGRGAAAAESLSPGKDGVPVDTPDAVAVDPVTGQVYFTDLGTIFSKTTNMTEILLSGDTSGRLLKYDPKTRRRSVVLTGLAVPNGVAVSRDGAFILVSEYIACRITRFWVKGPKANTSDIFAELPGNSDNIRRTKKGDFWVAVNIQKLYPKLTSFPLGQKINEDGQIVETLNFYKEYNLTYVTEVHEHDGALYVASVYTDFIGIYQGLKR